MAYKFNLDAYRRKHSLRGAAILRTKRRTERSAGAYFASRLRVYVPNKSGRLRRSIRQRGSSVRIGASGNDNFPYIHWINQTYGRGMQTLRVKPKGKYGKPIVSIEGNPIHVKGGIMRYGSAPSNWSWTGRVRFVTVAKKEAKARFRQLVVRNTRKAMIGEIVT